jgi:hypothetical protein
MVLAGRVPNLNLDGSIPMRRLGSLVLALVLAFLAVPVVLAQTGEKGDQVIPPPSNPPCDTLVRRCAEMTDDELWAAAFLDPNRNPHSLLGTCYFHDDSNCPTCACPFYVKISYLPPPSGYDNGTGCLQTREEVLAVLRRLCVEGQCGCPHKTYSQACIQVVAYAKDPLTGTCCQFGTPCNILEGWIQYPSMEECQRN